MIVVVAPSIEHVATCKQHEDVTAFGAWSSAFQSPYPFIMPISCEACRLNLGQLVSPRSPGPLLNREAGANDLAAASQAAHATQTTGGVPSLQSHATRMNPVDASAVDASAVDASAVDASAVEEHVAVCEECSRELMRLRRMVGALHELPVLAAPVDLRARIQSQLKAEMASSISTHAAAQATTAAQAADTRKNAHASGSRDVGKARAASGDGRDFTRGWSRFWTRVLRHRARASWAGGAILCALAFVVASRPNSLWLSSPASNEEQSATPMATAPAPTQKAVTSASSAKQNRARQTSTSNSAGNATTKDATPETASPAAPLSNPNATRSDTTGGANNGAMPPRSNTPLRAPSTSATPAAQPKTVAPVRVPNGHMSTHDAAPIASPRRVTPTSKPPPVALSRPDGEGATAKSRQDASETREAGARLSLPPRLARLELLPDQAPPQAPRSVLRPEDAPDLRPDNATGMASSDSQNGISQRAAPSREAAKPELGFRPAPAANAPSLSTQSGAPSPATPSIRSESSHADAADLAASSSQTSDGREKSDAPASPPAKAGRGTSGELERDGAFNAAPKSAAPNDSARKRMSAGGSSATANGATTSATASDGETEKKPFKPSIGHRSGSAADIDKNGPLPVRDRSRRARLLVSPHRDASRARVRVLLSGLAWSDATSASASNPRIVWQGQAQKGREIEISLSFAPLAKSSVSGKTRATLRVELQQARGDKWQTLQTQNLPVDLR